MRKFISLAFVLVVGLIAGAWTHGVPSIPSTAGWQRLQLGGGGAVSGLTINQTTGIRFSRTDDGGAYIWGNDNSWHQLATYKSLATSGMILPNCLGFCPLNNVGTSTQGGINFFSSNSAIEVMGATNNSSVAYLYWNGYVFVSNNISKATPDAITWCMINAGSTAFAKQANIDGITPARRFASPFIAVDPYNADHVLVTGTFSGNGVWETFNGTQCTISGGVATNSVTWTSVPIPLGIGFGNGTALPYAVGFGQGVSGSCRLISPEPNCDQEAFIFTNAGTTGTFNCNQGNCTYNNGTGDVTLSLSKFVLGGGTATLSMANCVTGGNSGVVIGNVTPLTGTSTTTLAINVGAGANLTFSSAAGCGTVVDSTGVIQAVVNCNVSCTYNNGTGALSVSISITNNIAVYVGESITFTAAGCGSGGTPTALNGTFTTTSGTGNGVIKYNIGAGSGGVGLVMGSAAACGTWVEAGGQGIYHTLNGGTSWTQISGPAVSAGPSQVGHWKVSTASTGNGNLWVTDGSGGGNAWRYSQHASPECGGAAPCWVQVLNGSSQTCTAANAACFDIGIDSSNGNVAIQSPSLKNVWISTNPTAAAPTITFFNGQGSISGLTSYSSGTATLTLTLNHGLNVGDSVDVAGITTGVCDQGVVQSQPGPDPILNGRFVLTGVTATTVSYSAPGSTATPGTVTANCGHVYSQPQHANAPWQNFISLNLGQNAGATSGGLDADPTVAHQIIQTASQAVWYTQMPSNSPYSWYGISQGIEELIGNIVESVGPGRMAAGVEDEGICNFNINSGAGATPQLNCGPTGKYMGLANSNSISRVPPTAANPSFTVAVISADAFPPTWNGTSTDGFATDWQPFNGGFVVQNLVGSNVTNTSGHAGDEVYTVPSTSALTNWNSPSPGQGSMLCQRTSMGLTTGIQGICYPATVIDSTHVQINSQSTNSYNNTTSQMTQRTIWSLPATPGFFSNWNGGFLPTAIAADGNGAIQVSVPRTIAATLQIATNNPLPVCLSGITGTTEANGCWQFLNYAPSAPVSTASSYNAGTGVMTITATCTSTSCPGFAGAGTGFLGGGVGTLINITGCTATVTGPLTGAQAIGLQVALSVSNGAGTTTYTYKPQIFSGGVLVSPTTFTLPTSGCTITLPTTFSLWQSTFTHAWTGGGNAYLYPGQQGTAAASTATNFAFTSVENGVGSTPMCTTDGGRTWTKITTSGSPFLGAPFISTGNSGSASPVTATTTGGSPKYTAGTNVIGYVKSDASALSVSAITMVQLDSGRVMAVSTGINNAQADATSHQLLLQFPIPQGDSITDGNAIYQITGFSSTGTTIQQLIVADQVTPNTFYAMNLGSGLYKWANCGTATQVTSDPTQGGVLFGSSAGGLPNQKSILQPVIGEAGHLFFVSGWNAQGPSTNHKLYRTCNGVDNTVNWNVVPGFNTPQTLSLGKNKTGQPYGAAEYITGFYAADGFAGHAQFGVWKSINDPNHGLGTGSTCDVGAPLTSVTVTAGKSTMTATVGTGSPAASPWGTLRVGDFVTDCGDTSCSLGTTEFPAGAQIDGMAGAGNNQTACVADTAANCTGTGAAGNTGTYHLSLPSPGGVSLANALAIPQTWTNLATAANNYPAGIPLGWSPLAQDVQADQFIYGPVYGCGNQGCFYGVFN